MALDVILGSADLGAAIADAGLFVALRRVRHAPAQAPDHEAAPGRARPAGGREPIGESDPAPAAPVTTSSPSDLLTQPDSTSSTALPRRVAQARPAEPLAQDRSDLDGLPVTESADRARPDVPGAAMQQGRGSLRRIQWLESGAPSAGGPDGGHRR